MSVALYLLTSKPVGSLLTTALEIGKIKVGHRFQLSSRSFCLAQRRDSSLPLLMVILLILQELCRSYCFQGDEISRSQFLLGLRSNHCRVNYILAVQQIFYLCMKQLSRIWDGVGVIVLQEITTINFTSFLWEAWWKTAGILKGLQNLSLLWSEKIFQINKIDKYSFNLHSFPAIGFGSSERKLCRWPFYELYLF